MNEIDISTPSSENVEDNLKNYTFEDTSVSAEPENEFDEPENNEDEADIIEKNTDNGLIFGKFKTLDEAHKSYKEAERAITKAAELEKELRQYQQEAEKYEQESVAQSKGYTDRHHMALEFDINQHEIENYAVAAEKVIPPSQRLQVAQLINKCRMTGTKEDLATLRRCFSPDIVALASEDLALYRKAREADYDQMRDQERTIRFNRKLNEFVRVNGSWVDTPAKAGLLEEALKVSDGRADLSILKGIIEAVEKDAIKKYQKNKIVLRENSEAQDSLKEPGAGSVRPKNKKWITREEFYKMTPQQETEKYDLIVEQVKLENQGLIPRMLTNV